MSSKQSDETSSKTKHGGEGMSSPKIAKGKRRWSEIEDENSDEEFDVSVECSGRRIFDIESLASAIEVAAVCNECKKGSLLLREDGKLGLASHITLQCVVCGAETEFHTDRKTGRFYPISCTVVFAAKSIGRGYAGLSRFCNSLDLPGPMAKKTFKRHSKQIRDTAVSEARASMSAAVEEVRQLNNCDDDDLADIGGTWMKRGHSSL